jgi:hypothetical protein
LNGLSLAQLPLSAKVFCALFLVALKTSLIQRGIRGMKLAAKKVA